jgi:hypothetical protein
MVILPVILVICITRDHLVTGGGSKVDTRRLAFLFVCAQALAKSFTMRRRISSAKL